MNESEKLTKDQRKAQRKEMHQTEEEKIKQKRKVKTILFWFSVLGIVVLIFYWIYKVMTAPKPGQEFPGEGRDHVDTGTKVTYKTNPPTSGSHYSEWEKSGIYETPLSDEKLVHSLEHGYIIISYNCDKSVNRSFVPTLIKPVFAHGELEGPPAPDVTTKPSPTPIDLSGWKNNTPCQKMVSKLSSFAKEQKLWKMIVVPRINMPLKIALTAWQRMDTMDGVNEKRMKLFVSAYRDHGPEKTME